MTARAESGRGVSVLVLAGGLGTRLRPLTDRLPKCLVPVGGRPLLDYWFDSFERAGLRRVVVNNHHLPDQLRAYLADKTATGRFDARESYEPVLLGSAGTVHTNRALADGASDVLIVYADNLSTVDLGALLDEHRRHGDAMTMLLFRAPVPERCGIAELDGAGRVVSFVEKPKVPKSNLANAGVYVVTAAAYREIADQKAFDFGFDVLPRFVGRMRGFEHPGYHLDIGTPEALARAEGDLAAGRVFTSAVPSAVSPGGAHRP